VCNVGFSTFASATPPASAEHRADDYVALPKRYRHWHQINSVSTQSAPEIAQAHKCENTKGRTTRGDSAHRTANCCMLGKPKLPFLINDSRRLDIEFYSVYDERFLYRKVRILRAALVDSDFMSQFQSEDAAPTEIEIARHALAAELLFTEFHQFESFFAILIAPFQELPHWVFLNTYSTSQIKEKVREFLARDFNRLSRGLTADRNAFFRRAGYGDCVSNDGKDVAWQETFENLWWSLERMAEKYSEADEYNSYKHGLRLMSSAAMLALSNNATDFSNAFVTRAPYAITHLKLEKKDAGTYVSIETKAFNPDESCAHIHTMAQILTNIKRVRLAVLSSVTTVELTMFPEIDKKGLQELAVLNRWTIPT
jgi:hypothetical protein